MKKIMESIYRVFGGRGIDKKFPFLLWAFKYVFSLLQRDIPIKVKTSYGKTLIVSGKDGGLGLMLRSGKDYELLLTELMKKSVKPGDVVVDIGANIGYFTKYLSQLVGNRGKVLAFEPSQFNWKYLTLNTGKLKNVARYPLAIGETEGEMTFGEDVGNPGENGFSKTGKQIVQVKTLESVMHNAKIKKMNWIKIDVEGAEVMVLRGASQAIRSQKSIVVACECNPEALAKLGYSTQELITEFKKCGLKITRIIDERAKRNVVYSQSRLRAMLDTSAFVTLIGERHAK